MSSRAIRRLRQEQEASFVPDEEEYESEEESQPKGGFLGMLDEESSDDSDEDSDDAGSQGAVPREVVKPAAIMSSKVEEDLDAILSSFHEHSTLQFEDSNTLPSLRSILLSPSRGFDPQTLDLDYAVRSLLGAVVGADDDVQRGQRRKKGRSKTVKKYLFGRPRETWGKPPSYVGGGLGCKELTQQVLVEERHSWEVPWPYNLQEETTNSNNTKSSTIPPNQKWYTLTMSDTYEEEQNAYHQLLRRNTHSNAIEDPNALAMFVADHPHYADTLLQLSMVLYHVNDRSKGNDLLRRTMYLYETALPSSVLPNNAEGNDVFMDIERQPNQGLFATLFRIMQTSGMTGCHPNALATGRFLLSLDPLRDPMGVLLILDYYALACRTSVLEGNEMGALFIKELVESELIQIHYKDPLTDRYHCCELRDMPGWAYSYALTLFRLANHEECEEKDLQEKADEALIDALTKFPIVLSKLLAMNKVNTQDRSFIMDWPKILPVFTHDSDDVTEGSVQDRVAKGAGLHLVRIFVQRHHKLWAGDDVVQWMYRCAERVTEVNTSASDDVEEKEEASDQLSTNKSNHHHYLVSTFNPALARYAQFDPSEYEDAFRTLPPEAIALDPNIIAPAMEFDPNRRRRFLRRGQMQEEMHRDEGRDGIMLRLRDALGMGDDVGLDMLDPDSPLLQLYLQSLLPWNQVEGVRPPR